MSDQGRRRLSIVLAGLASLLAVLALVAAYALHAGVNSDQFANRATVALRDDNVSNLVAQKITDDVVLKKDQDLLAARPLIESVTPGIVGSRPFTDLFRSAVGDVHRALFAGDKDTVTLTVPDVGTVLEAALEKLKPALAADLNLAGRVELVQRDIGSVGGGLAHLAHTVRVLGWILFALCLLFAGGAIWVAPDRRDAVVALGVGAAVAGGALIVLYAIGRSIAIHHVSGPSGQAAAAGVWDAFLGDLQTEAWILAGAGAVVAAAASSLIRPPEIGAPLRGLADRLAVEPQTRTGQALRAGAFVVAGVIVLTQADAVIRIAITIAGLYLIYEGVAAGLKLMYRPRPADERGLREEIEGELEELFRPTRAHHVIAGGVVVIVVAGALTVWLGSGSGTIAAPATGACEGNAALCDRSLEQIALPATHNAMSVPLPGWYSAEQDRPIADQLNDGIRGLLLDTHYGDKLPDGAVRTDLGKTSKVANQDAVSPQAVEAAKRIRNNLGFAGEGERGMYLCHTFCEIGARPSTPVSATSMTSSSPIPTPCSSSSTRTTSSPPTSSTRSIGRGWRTSRTGAPSESANGRRFRR